MFCTASCLQTTLGGFCLSVELHQEGSAINEATPSSLFKMEKKIKVTFKSKNLISSGINKIGPVLVK